MNNMHKCNKCLKEKQKSEFYLRVDGRPRSHCKVCMRAFNNQYREVNSERYREQRKAHDANYYRKNLDKDAAKKAKRRASKIQRTPRWVDEVELANIRCVYSEARIISETSGINHEVDHIVPLNGKTVCGLHTIHNLQIISAYKNRSKGNRLTD